jgi:putative tricarboxylic transport membrane protein
MGEGLRSVFRYWRVTGRSTAIGVAAGALPGLGASSGNLIANSSAQRQAGRDGRFGQGDIRGVIAPESCNNATVAPSLIPTLTLGVPGTLSAAIFMGALVLHGLTPGRELVRDHPDVLYGIVLFMLLSAVVLLPAALATAGTMARISSVPVHILVPVITVLLVFGVFSNRRILEDVLLLVGVGVVGYFLELYGFPSAPLLIAFILGPVLEVNMRRAMSAGDGTLAPLVDEPVHWILAIVALLILARPLLDRPLERVRGRLGRSRAEEAAPAPDRQDENTRSL